MTGSPSIHACLKSVAAVVSALLLWPTIAAAGGGANTPEIEPNDSKATATAVVRPMEPGDTISGIAGGAGGADYFRVRSAAAPRGIYRHRLTPVSGSFSSDGLSVRGVQQVVGVLVPGSDRVASGTSAITTNDRYIQWYGFGRGEEIYIRVAGNGPFELVHSVTVVTPDDLGVAPAARPLTIRTAPDQVSQTYVPMHAVYTPAGDLVTNERSARLAPGEYLVAVGIENDAFSNYLALCTERALPTGENVTSSVAAAALDFPHAVVGGFAPVGQGATSALSTDAGVGAPVQLTRAGAFDVMWARFTIAEDCGPGWTAVAPPPRRYHAMAYDPVRDRVVLFGGATSSAAISDTWEFDGASWHRRYVDGPFFPVDASMVFDAAAQRMILYGGGLIALFPVPSAFRSGTWSYDGTSWARIADATQPGGRTGPAMAYDAARQQVVLFGGTTGAGGVNTFVWTGTAWTIAATTGPTARSGTAMAYDAARQRVVLFGGHDGTNHLSDTWAWDGSMWMLAPAAGPPARSDHTLTYDAARQRVVLIGGGNPHTDGVVWEWDGAMWTAAESEPLARRFDHGAAYDSTRGRIVVVGGTPPAVGGSQLQADPSTIVRSQTEWSVVDTGPGARWLAASAYDALRQRTVVYGGGRWGGTTISPPSTFIQYALMGDTWLWDGQRWLAPSAQGPGRRLDAAMAFDGARGECVLFGGASGPNTLVAADTWAWDGSAWVQRATTGPAARRACGMAFDPIGQRVLLFGGRDVAGTPMGDTWSWNGSAWTPLAVPGPSPRFGHSMATDPRRGRIVLFGGATALSTNIVLGETWEWTGSAWMQIAAAGPPARVSAQMCFDAASNRIILAGGGSNSAANTAIPRSVSGDELWEWDGSTWRKRAGALPIATSGGMMVYDAARSQFVLTGGTTEEATGFYGATYVLNSHPPAISQQPAAVVTSVGGMAMFSVAGAFAADAAYQWQRDGVPLSDGGAISGAAAATLSISPVSAHDAGFYTVLITDRCGAAASDPARLIIACPGDFNNDGDLNADDLSDFITCFFADVASPGACPAADFNTDGARDPDDLSDFMSAYFGGCP